MVIPNEFIVFESNYWIVNHRMMTTYSGYLMLSSKIDCTELSDLDANSLAELGYVLSKMEKLIKEVFNPYKILICKLGFSVGFNVHFHLVPVYDWVFDVIPTGNNSDGNDVMLFINRIFCENQDEKKSLIVVQSAVDKIKKMICTNSI